MASLSNSSKSGSGGDAGSVYRSSSSPEGFIGDPLPAEELAMWTALSTSQRAKALQRMTALERWLGSNGEVDVKRAAADAGVSVTRMYEMGKRWRQQRSLKSLGTFAAAPKTRLGKHDAAINRLVGSVVDADPTASVRKLALGLEAALAREIPHLPSHNTFRRYVERELRRRDREATAGNDVMLDCSACVLTPTDNILLTLFAVLDRATQVVVGAALGDVADSRAGYALAASDGARRLSEGQFNRLRWVDRMERGEIVVGTDIDAWPAANERFGTPPVLANVEISTKEGRFGRYLRTATNLRIGTLVIMPKHTVGTPADGRWTRSSEPTVDQQARLAVEVDEYNAATMSGLEHGSNQPPPSNLSSFLEVLADV